MKKFFASFLAGMVLNFVFSPLAVKASFPDIQNHKYQEAIQFIAERGIVGGYPDGTFKPDNPVKRGELLKIILNQKYPKLSAAKCFTDVSKKLWFSKFACKARSLGIVKGYPDGSFRGGDKAKFAEALKILLLAYDMPYKESTGPKWYGQAIADTEKMNIIPPGVKDFGGEITRGQMAEMLMRLLKYKEGARQSNGLLQSRNLVWQGAFRLPAGEFGGSSFEYGGTALAYNPENDSLFMAGHAWHQQVAEIKIPKIVASVKLADLNTAEVLQSFTDPTEGKMASVDQGGINVGGLMLYEGKLYESAYSYYDADANQKKSHFVTSPDLSQKEDVAGPFELGTLGAGFVSGYMAQIPTEWQSSLGGPALTGNCCIAIISRSSYGPAAFVFNPEDLSVKDPVPDTPLVYYPSDHTLGNWGETNSYFNGSTSMGGVVFPAGSRSVLFIGVHGTGEFCYGGGAECADPENSSKGTHGYPYAYQVWAYDVLDLIEVKNGKKQPWEIKPYTMWDFDLPVQIEAHRIGGVAYDQKGNRIFISQMHADHEGYSSRPVIHVFKVIFD